MEIRDTKLDPVLARQLETINSYKEMILFFDSIFWQKLYELQKFKYSSKIHSTIFKPI